MTHVTLSLEDWNNVLDKLEDYEERLTVIEEKTFPQEEEEEQEPLEVSGKTQSIDIQDIV